MRKGVGGGLWVTCRADLGSGVPESLWQWLGAGETRGGHNREVKAGD